MSSSQEKRNSYHIFDDRLSQHWPLLKCRKRKIRWQCEIWCVRNLNKRGLKARTHNKEKHFLSLPYFWMQIYITSEYIFKNTKLKTHLRHGTKIQRKGLFQRENSQSVFVWCLLNIVISLKTKKFTKSKRKIR